MGLDLALRGAPLQLSDFGRPLTPDEQLAAEQTRAEMTSTPGRAWKSAGLGAKAASLWDAANAAYIDNDLERAQQLEAQAKEYGQRAGIMAVPIQETKDINGVGDAVDYATGHLVSGVRSTLPVIGASMAGGFLGGPVGAGLGALGAGYGLGREQSLSQSMQDEAIRNTRSYQDMRNTAHLQGLAEGALDALVPAAMTGKVFRGFTAKGLGPAFPQMMNYAEKRAWLEGQKTAARELAESGLGGAARHFGKNVAEGFGGEFITGGAQDVSGQMFQNELRGDPVGNVDWRQAFESALAEGVGGTGFGAIGGGAEIIGAHRANPDVGVAGSYDLGERTLGATYEKGKEALGFLYKDVVTKYAPVFREELGKTATWLHKEVKTVSEAIYPVLKEDTAAVVQAVVPDVVKTIAVLGYDAAKVAKVLGSDGLAAITQIAKDLTPEELRTEIDAAMTKVGDAAMKGAAEGLRQSEVVNALERGVDGEMTSPARALGRNIGATVTGAGEGLAKGLWNEGKKAAGHLWDKLDALTGEVSGIFNKGLKTALDSTDIPGMLREARPFIDTPESELKRRGLSETGARTEAVASSNEATTTTMQAIRTVIDAVGLTDEHPTVARFAELEAKAKGSPKGSPKSLGSADRKALGRLSDEFSNFLDDRQAVDKLAGGNEQVPHSRAKRNEDKETDLFFRDDVKAVVSELFANTPIGKSAAQIKTAADNVARVVDGIAAGRSTKAKPGEEAVDYLSRAKGFAEYLAGVFGKDAVDNFFYKLEDLAHARYGPESAQGLRLARARGRDFADFVEKMTTPGHNGHPLINLDLWTYADDSPSSRARRGTRIIRELMQAVRDAREAEARPALSDEGVLSGITPANGGAAEYINRRDALAKARKPEHLKKLTKELVMSGVIRPNTMPQIVKELEAYEKSGLEEPDKHGPVPDADQAASRVVEIEDPNDFDERQLAAEGTSTDDSDADNEKLTMRDDNERGTHGEFQGVSWHGAESFTGEGTQAKRKRGGVPTPVHRFNRGEHLDKGEMSSETRALGAELDARYGHRVTERGFMRVTEWADEQVAASSGKMRRKTLLEKARDAVLAHDEARKERLNERAKFSKSEAHSAQIARELKEIDARKEYAKGATAEQFFDRYKAYGYYRLTQHPGGNVVFTVKDLQRYSVRDGETVEEYIGRQITEDDVFSKPFSREVYKASLLPVKLEGDKGWLALDLPRLLEATRRRHQPGDTSGVTSHSRKARSEGPLTSTEGYSSDYRKGLIQDVSNLLATIQLTKEVAPDAFGKWAKGELNTTNTGKHTAYDELNPEQVVSRDLEARQALTWGDLRGVKVDADGKLRKDSTRFVRTRVATTVKDHWGREQTEFVEKIKKNHWTPGEMSKETLDTVVTPTQAKGVDANNLRLQGTRGVEVAALRKVDAPGKLFNLNARALLRHMLERAGHDPSAMMHEGLPRPLAVRLLWEGMHELREQGYELRETSTAVANLVEVYDAGEYLDHFGDLVPNKVTLGSLRGKIHPDNDNNTPHDIETARVQQIKENLAKLRRDLVSNSGDGENAPVREQQREKLIRLQKQREKLVTALDTLETELKKKAAEAEARFEGSLGPALREYPESERAKAARAEANNIKDSETNDRAREELENTIALREKRLSKLDKEIAALKSTVSLSEDAQKGLTETLSKQEWNERNLGWTTGEPTDDDHRALRYSPEEMENIRVNEVVRDLKKLSDGDPSLFDISTELEKIYTPKRRQGKASATPMTDAQKLDALRSLSMRVALLFPEVKWDTDGYEKGVKPADTSRPHERLIKDTEAWVAQQEADGKPVDPKIKETLAYVKDRQVKDKQDAEVIAKHPSHNPSTSGKRGTGLGGLEVDPRTINPLDAETQGKQRAAKQKRADEAAKARQWLKDNPEFDEGQLDTPQPDAPQTETTQVETPPQPMSVEKIVAQVMAGKFKYDVQREVLPTLSEADTWKLYEKLKNAQRRPGTDRAATVRELSMRGYDALSYNDWLDKQAVPFSKAKRKGMAQLSRAKSPDADAKPSEDYQPGEEFKRIIGETFGFKLVGKEDWAAKWTLDDKGRLKDVLMSFYGLNEAESIGMERHEAWHGVEQLLEGMGDVGKQILDDITSWADSEHARAWLAKKLEPYPDALADIDDTKNPKLAAKERKAYAFQFFMEEGKMPPGKAQGWFNKIKEAIRKFFNWTGLKTTSDLQRAEAFFKYVGEGNFLRDAENPASVLEGLGKTKTDKFVEDVKGAIKPISDAVDVLFAHTADRVKGMKIAAYTELLKIYEGESGKGGYMLAQRTQFNRHANMFIHMRKGKDEKALPGVVREFKEKFRGYLSQALSAEDIQNLYDKVNTFNHDAINDNMEAFLNDLRLYGGLKDKTPGELRNIASDIANKGYYYDENAPIRLFEKKPEIMEKWKERSPNGEIYRLVRIGTRMVERNRFFGKNDERLHNLLAQGNHEASAEQQELTRKVVDAFEGRLGGDLSPGMRTLFNALTTANNIRLLPMAVFSQMLDPVRLAARKNDFASSLDPLFKGIKDMPRAWFDNAEKQGAKDTWEKLAEETGILANLALGNMMSELNLGYRMGGKLGWLNDKFFKYNFMEQWERSMTVSATKMGVEFLREHSASKTAQSKRYLDELGLDSGDVKFDKDGALITDEKVSAALAQYVAESLAHPDAGSNPLWMNDQRFALMSHLKRFSFAHQRYVLDRGVREYKLGNASILAPAVMAVPWMLTVDALRDAINPFSSTGYKADWGAADYLTSGMDRAGHTGKWQMPHDVMRNLTHGGDPFSPVLGPTADAFGRIVRKTRKGDGVEAMIDAIPGSSLFRPM